FKRTIREIVEMRESRRIGLPTAPRQWTAREIRLLGTMTDSELGRRFRRAKYQVRARRVAFRLPPFKQLPPGRAWKAGELKLLGTWRDDELAGRLKRTTTSVELKRIRLGIPAFARINRLYTSAEDRIIHRCTAAEAAMRTGRTLAAVLMRRQHIGASKSI